MRCYVGGGAAVSNLTCVTLRSGTIAPRSDAVARSAHSVGSKRLRCCVCAGSAGAAGVSCHYLNRTPTTFIVRPAGVGPGEPALRGPVPHTSSSQAPPGREIGNFVILFLAEKIEKCRRPGFSARIWSFAIGGHQKPLRPEYVSPSLVEIRTCQDDSRGS